MANKPSFHWSPSKQISTKKIKNKKIKNNNNNKRHFLIKSTARGCLNMMEMKYDYSVSVKPLTNLLCMIYVRTNANNISKLP